MEQQQTDCYVELLQVTVPLLMPEPQLFSLILRRVFHEVHAQPVDYRQACLELDRLG